jgi:hypothetical protein
VKPDRLAVSALLLKQACTLIEARHGAPARLAEPDEVPSARQREARGKPVGEEVVEQWPPDEHQAETVVAEYITAPTFFLRADATLGSGWWTAATDSVPDARSFESAAEANEWLQHHGVGNHFALRYQAAARAEADQRETAAYDQDVTT